MTPDEFATRMMEISIKFDDDPEVAHSHACALANLHPTKSTWPMFSNGLATSRPSHGATR